MEELSPGTVSRAVDFAGQEYRLSYGKDEQGRPSVLVRPGPAMRTPLLVEIFGRKAVLSPNASLMATLADDRQVFYEPSICGEVYYIEDFGGTGSKVSRLASTRREVAVWPNPPMLEATVPEHWNPPRMMAKAWKKPGMPSNRQFLRFLDCRINSPPERPRSTACAAPVSRKIQAPWRLLFRPKPAVPRKQ